MTNTELLNQLCRDRESSMRRILEATDDGEFDAALDRLAGEGLAGDGAASEQDGCVFCLGCPVCQEKLVETI